MTSDVGRFTVIDIVFFTITFFLSAAIGIYHGCASRRKANTREEYLLGGRQMGLLPVTASLVATAVSGSTLLGHVTEVYAFGTQAWMFCFAFTLTAIIVPAVFLPVFMEIGELSSFKYLELRFSRSIRMFASALYILTSLLFLPVTVYVPALAFHEISGLSVHLITGILTLLCVSYTAFGGIKAVVWTDVLQITLAVLSSATVAIVGMNQAGGFQKIWQSADEGGRLIFFNFNPDPTVRATFWPYISSMVITSIYQIGIHQTSIQRYLSLSNIRKANFSVWGFIISFTLIMLLSQFIGVIIYATYQTCDPFRSGQIKKIDQILPHYIERNANIFPGFLGIFIAGLFSASLSSTSSYLNTLSGNIYDDFLARYFRNASESRASNIVKLIVVLLGLLQILLLLLIEKLGTIFSMTMQVFSLATSALLGLFTLGMLSRRVNSKGALSGSLVSVLVILILIIGGQYKKPDAVLPLRTDGCDWEALNATNFLPDFKIFSEKKIIEADDVPWIFKIHFMYYGLIGFTLNILVGYIVSIATGGNHSGVDEKLLARFLRRKVHKTEEEESLKTDKSKEHGEIIKFQSISNKTTK